MTEYTTKPEVVARYMNARQRTMHWVDTHVPSQTEFYSPSVPPVMLHDPDSPGYLPSDAESDAESVVSLPPRMVLKYGNGRPDIPISHWHYDNDSTRRSKNRPRVPEPRRGESHRRAQSFSNQPSSTASRHSNSNNNQHRLRISSLPAPEEIRILPPSSRSQIQAQSPPRTNSYSQDSRSTSEVPRSSSTRQSTRHGPPQLNQPAPPLTHSQSQQSHSRNGQSQRSHGSRSPPAIVYAPSQRSGSNYAPPVIMTGSQYPQRAPGVTYSHSTPVPLPSQKSHFLNAGATPYPSAHGTQLSSVREEGTRGRANSRRIMDSAVFVDSADAESHDSGSTYYVIPTPGQKIHVIVSSMP
jgi:hypothetical protein